MKVKTCLDLDLSPLLKSESAPRLQSWRCFSAHVDLQSWLVDGQDNDDHDNDDHDDDLYNDYVKWWWEEWQKYTAI